MEWKKIKVVLQVRDRLLGGVPKNPEMIEGWVRGLVKKGKLAEDEATAIIAETKDSIEQTEEKSWTGFKRDAEGIYIEERHIKGHLKETAKVVGAFKDIKGFRELITKGLYVKPEKIHLAPEPNGYQEESGQVMGMRGPRSILKRRDYLEKPKVVFTLWVLPRAKPDDIRALFEMGQEVGLLTDRTLGYGKYDLVSFEELKE